jgi:formyl-CoA transferase
MGGEVAPQAGNSHPTGTPTGVFETKDGHINIAASRNEIYERLCRAMERPDLITDPRFSSYKQRYDHREEMMEALTLVTRQKSSAEWIEILNQAGVPCGPIYKINESFADPQVQHLAMAQPVHSPKLGDITILGHPVSFGADRPALRKAAPEFGQDTKQTLTAMGYTNEQIARLSQRGVI